MYRLIEKMYKYYKDQFNSTHIINCCYSKKGYFNKITKQNFDAQKNI